MERRVRLFFIMSFIVILTTMMYMQKKYPRAERGPAVSQPTATGTPPGAAPGATAVPGSPTAIAAAPSMAAPMPESYPEGPKVRVRTGVFDVVFSTNGAAPERWDIIDPKYMTKNEDHPGSGPLVEHLIDPQLARHPTLPRPFQTVLQELNSRYYNEFNREVFTHRQLDEAGLVHQFSSPVNPAGLQMVKTYSFRQDGYQVGLKIELRNSGTANINFGGGDRGLGIVLGPGVGGDSNGDTGLGMPYGSVDAVLKAEDAFLYEHLGSLTQTPGGVTPGGTITQDRTRVLRSIAWGGIVSKYFVAVLIPDAANPIASANALLDNRVLGTLVASEKNVGVYPVVEMYGAPFTIRPDETVAFGYTAYLGPMQHGLLADAGHDLTRAMFHSSWNWMRALCLFMMTLLFWLHGALNNWGLAIIMLTILVRLATLPMVHKGLKSQAKMTQQMSRIKPLIDKVNEKFKDDPQRKQQEIFKLYREHNINPLGMLKGCGWMLVQMPIFIGLYMVLYQVIDLRGAPFLWMEDLSKPENLVHWGVNLPLLGAYLNVLPFIVAISQMLTSKFMQTPATDPQQQQMQQMMTWFMPIFILAITYRFPSGLMLYWLVSNLWQVVQQIYVNKVIKKPQAVQA